MKRIFLILISLLIVAFLVAQSVRKDFKSEGWSGNPVFEGWYARLMQEKVKELI